MALQKIGLERIPSFVKTLLLLIPLIIIFVLVNHFVLKPKAKRLEVAKKEVEKLNMEITKHKQQLADFVPLDKLEKKEIAETNEAFQLMVKSLTPVREIYDKITSKAVSCGIMDLSIDPSYRPTQAEEIVKTESQLKLDQYKSYMKLNFHCELKSLGCFLEGLTGGGDYLIIESMNIRRELPRPGVELVLKLFTKS